MSSLYSISIPLLWATTYIGATYSAETKPAVEAPRQNTPHVISWFFQTKPSAKKKPYSEAELYDIVNTIRSSQQNFIDQRRKSAYISGIPVLYRGRIALSNENGQIILPRLHEEDTITIIITERPIPIITHGNTVDGWNIRNPLTALSYSCTRTIEGTKGVWSIQQNDTIPFRIPDDALIILGPPTGFILSEGSFTTDTSYNLILPDIMVVPEVINHPTVLNEIALSRFFQPTIHTHVYTPQEVRYAVLTT